MLVLAFIGNGGVVIQPMLLGGMVDELGISERLAGIIVTCEMLGFAFSALLVSARVHIVNRRALAVIALTVVIIGNIASAFSEGILMLGVCRFIAGLGAGACVAVFNATVAGCQAPDKRFAQILVAVMLYAGIAVYFAALLIDAYGLWAVFISLAVLACSGFLTVNFIPERAPKKHVVSTATNTVGRPRYFYVGALLFGYFLLYAGHMAIWSYQERIGVALGLNRETIGLILGSAMLFGMMGASLAIYLDMRLGRAWPQIISLSLSIVAALSLVYGDHLYVYMFSAYLITFSWYYGLPYLTGLMAWLDESGRVAALGGTMFTLGSVCGPAIAVSVITFGGYRMIGWIGAIFYVLCLCLVLPVAYASDASRKAMPQTRESLPSD
jgi:predicted MFS family arabinose efflux permease